MKFKIVCLEVAAIFVCYLVFSLSLVSATNVKIYYNGAYQSPAVQYNPQSLVSVSLIADSSLSVTLNVSSSTGIESVYVYKCRGLSPSSCMSGVSAEPFAGPFEKVYSWSSLADKTTGYPQKANLLILAKVSGAWTGFWYVIERPDASTFMPRQYTLDEIEVHAKDLDDVSLIRNFVSVSRMIPFNAQWVTRVVFTTASGLHEMQASSQELESAQFSVSESSQNSLSQIERDYAFVLANSGDVVFSPAVLNLNPGYICGNGRCETDKGEGQSNCCIDCACQAGYYCDASGGCRQLSGVTLSVYGTPSVKVSNCNQQHTLTIPVKISNPPSGMAITSMRFRLGSGAYQPFSCSGDSSTGHIYSCPVVVPAVTGCSEGTYRVGPNYINFTISYTDGKSTSSRTMSTIFPDITIGSYTCGNGVCEASLEESQTSCCYDCGCASGYCNAADPNALNGSCSPDPAAANLRVTGLYPTQFYTHKQGDSVGFLLQVANSPVTMTASDYSCSIDCLRGDGLKCTSSCTVSCTKVSGSAYNSSCSMGFAISDYDSLKSYALFPVLNFSANYANGSTGSLQKSFSVSVPKIIIGSHWCGDKKCDPDESKSSCCFDCGCEGGLYCNTASRDSSMQGDSCRVKPEIEKDYMTETVFTSSYEEHTINFTGHSDSRPGGASLSANCAFNSTISGVPCYTSCSETTPEGNLDYMFLCKITVPEINYSKTQFFNQASRRITLGPSWINITLTYNNGTYLTSDEYSFPINDVSISVVPRCGDGYGNPAACERNIGENSSGCCLDCGCLDKGRNLFCYIGRLPGGECLSNSSIQMVVSAIEPDPINCTISEKGGKCLFTGMPSASATIINPPSGLEIANAYYRIGTSGNYTEASCIKLGEGSYYCPFEIAKIANSNPGAETRTLQMRMTVSYLHNGVKEIQSLSDSKDFTIERAYNPALASCIEQENSIDKELSSLESEKTMYTVLAVIFFIMSLLFWAAYISSCGKWGACEEWYKWWAIVAGLIGGCGLTFVLNKLSSIDQQMQQLKAQKSSLCGASTFSSLSSAVSGTGNMIYSIGQIYGGATCLFAGMAGLQASGVIGSGSGGAATGSGNGITSAGRASPYYLEYVDGKGVESLINMYSTSVASSSLSSSLLPVLPLAAGLLNGATK